MCYSIQLQIRVHPSDAAIINRKIYDTYVTTDHNIKHTSVIMVENTVLDFLVTDITILAVEENIF